ncbi:hypothetical protein B0H34DRAFT_682832 [Crassisporium funariophilum]|nr:hypothetical protein B0H34DRAFT_682832 [Crassisporium funariophilum]
MGSIPLPPFLHPFPKQTTEESAWQNAHFIHKDSLGSSHALWWPPRQEASSDPDVIVLFIPGNPGLVDFYIPFLSTIYEKRASPNLAILAHAHVDHAPGIKSSGSIKYPPSQSLTIQIQSSLEVLDAITSTYTQETKVVVVGHSVGAWISSQLLKARPNEIASVFFLFPTISHIGNTPNGRRLSPIFSPISRSILSWLSPLAKYIPFPVLSLLFSGWPQHQVLVLHEFIASPRSVLSSLTMAHEEMKHIRDLDLVLLEQHKHKLLFYYAEKDDWVGEEKISLMRAFGMETSVPRVVQGPSDVPHAFCINHGEIMGQHCHDWLISFLEERGELGANLKS